MENPECKTPSSNMDEEDQKKKRSPLKSPQLCGEDYPPNNLHLQMARLSDVTSDRSTPSYARSTTESRNKERKDCRKRLSMKDKEIEKLEGIIKDLEIQVQQNRKKHEDDLHRTKLICENKLQEYIEVIFSSKREISRLTSELQKRIEEEENLHETSIKRERETKLEKFYDLQRQVNILEDMLFKAKSNLEKEQEKTERLTHQNQEKEVKLTDMRLKCMRAEKTVSILSKDIKDIQASKRQVDEEKLKDLQAENASLKSALSKATNEIEDLLNKGTNLQKYKTDAEHKTSTLMNALKEKETEIEALSKHLARLEEFKTKYYIVKSDNKKVWENCSDLKRKLEDKVNELENVNSKLNRAESLSLEVKILQREKENVEEQNNELIRALQAKGIEMESLIKHRERSEKQIRNLNNEISDIQKSKRHTVNESLQQLLTENSSLKSTLEHRTLEIEYLSKECEKQRRTREKGEHEMTELEQMVQKKKNEVEELNTRLEEFSKKCSALHRDKEEAHAKISALTDALYEKKRDVESFTNQLERAENKVSILLKDIEDIQESKRLADEKLKGLQTENSSLKSALSKATNEIEDLLNKGTNLQKYKTNAEYKTSTLKNAMKEKKSEIEALREQLARAEKNVSILSQDIKDIQASKRQVTEEKLQDLQTETASLKSALCKATNEIDDLRNKCTNLEKYKTDTEHTINTLMHAAKEKETEYETLNKQLASYDQIRKDSNEAKRERDHDFKRLTSVAEGNGKRDSKGLM